MPAAQKPDAKLVRRYIWFQVPGVVLAGGCGAFAMAAFGTPGPWVAAALALWILKDIAFFPLTWRAYATGEAPGFGMRGRRGTVESALAPRGVVRVGGERWRALPAAGEPELPPGAQVQVRDVRGLELIVARAPRAAGQAAR